jgi:dienelactone hydrolase
MADVLLFHHAQGLTEGVREFAGQLRAAGHRVTVPDLFEGATFGTVDEGVAHAQQVGFGAIAERGRRAAGELPPGLVYAGMSLGAMPAQMLAQTRPGARGALLMSGCLPAAEYGPWPDAVPVQVHGMDADPWFAEDLDAARDLARTARDAELFLYPGHRHLFADSSLPDYDEPAAALLRQRVLAFLAQAG